MLELKLAKREIQSALICEPEASFVSPLSQERERERDEIIAHRSLRQLNQKLKREREIKIFKRSDDLFNAHVYMYGAVNPKQL